MRGLFVTGTDTGVGKTALTAGVVLALRGRGHSVGVVKPIQSGALAADPDGDAMLLKRWTGVAEAASELAPYCFAAPLAPLVAADLEGREVRLAEVVEAVQAVADRYESVIVEGAGGLLVPVGANWTVADLAYALGLPVLVVARAALGTVNHSALTVLALRGLGLEPIGVVLNGAEDDSSQRNGELIERLADVPVLGRTPWLDGELTGERLRELVEENVDVGALAGAAIHSKEVARV